MSKTRGLLHKSKKEGKDQESIQSSTTPDPGYQWKSNKLTIRHHKWQVTTRQQQTDAHKSITNTRQK